MVRGGGKLVPWCRSVLGRQLDGIPASNGVITGAVEGRACRCLSSSAESLASLLDGTAAGGRRGFGNAARLSTVADATDDGTKASENEVAFGASAAVGNESLTGDEGIEFLKPPFSGSTTPDDFLFGAGGSDFSFAKEIPYRAPGTIPRKPKRPALPPWQVPDTPRVRVRSEINFRARNNSAVANLLKRLEAAASLDEVEKILEEHIPDLSISAHWPWLPLFEALQRGPKPQLALEVFDWKKDKFDGGDPREYAKMISIAGKLNQLEIATTIFEDMEKKGLKRSTVTCNALISAFSKNEQPDKALEIFQQMLDGEECRPTLVTYNTLISMYSKSSFSDMERIFELCKSSGFIPDKITFNSMIWGYMRSKEYVKMEEMYEEMKRSGFTPDPITFSGLIIGFAKANQMEKMELAFNHMQEEGFPISTIVADILTEFYALDKKFEKMERIIKITENTPSVSCNSRIFGFAIQAYAESGRIEDMEATLEKMFAAKKLFPSSKVLESVITAYGGRRFEALDAVLQKAKVMGWVYQHGTYHTLLYEYGKWREFEKMEDLFKEMEKAVDVIPTEETYKILADSYRAAGDGEGLKRTVDRMSAAGFQTKEVLDTKPETIWTDDEIFGGKRR